MKIGHHGIDLVKSFEGYGKELPDGRCTAYREMINGKLDVPTIGWGCTKSVAMGQVWTKAEADAALMAELEQHERRVIRLVTVDLNQHEFDALVSFDYNCGGLTTENGTSGVLKAINAGDRAGTVAEMKRWVKFGGRDAKGLIARRAAEVALFLRPVDGVETDYMPQDATPAAKPVKPGTAAWLATAGTSAGAYVAQNGIPVPPAPVTSSVDSIGVWKGLIATLTGLGALPLAILAGAAALAVLHYSLKWINGA